MTLRFFGASLLLHGVLLAWPFLRKVPAELSVPPSSSFLHVSLTPSLVRQKSLLESGSRFFLPSASKNPHKPESKPEKFFSGLGNTASGAGGTEESGSTLVSLKNQYLNKVRSRIETFLEYPHSLQIRKMSGTAIIHLSLNEEGTLLSHELIQSSGFLELDRLATRAIRSAAPFSPFPEGIRNSTGTLGFNIPVEFKN